MSFTVRNLSKFSNSQELHQLIPTNEITIEKVRFKSLKLNNDGHMSIEFYFDNKDGQINFLSKDDIEITFNIFGDDIFIKYNSFELLPIQTTLQEDMAIIHQPNNNGISLNVKYTIKPSLKFRIANL